MVEISPQGRRLPPKTISLQDNVYRSDPPRQAAVTIKTTERAPVIDLPQPDQVEMKANPMENAAEPTTLTTRPFERKPHWRDKLEVRRVVEADFEEMFGWAMPRLLRLYPRATQESLMPMLRLALAGGKMCFLRTESACGLFICETTPWEPLPIVYTAFVIARALQGDDLTEGDFAEPDGQKAHRYRALATGLQPTAIYRAGYKWAQFIGALEFWYGHETETDLTPIAKEIGFDRETRGWVKIVLKKETA